MYLSIASTLVIYFCKCLEKESLKRTFLTTKIPPKLYKHHVEIRCQHVMLLGQLKDSIYVRGEKLRYTHNYVNLELLSDGISPSFVTFSTYHFRVTKWLNNPMFCFIIVKFWFNKILFCLKTFVFTKWYFNKWLWNNQIWFC